LLKNGHLWRSPHPSSLRRTAKYASFLRTSGALHLTIFEQPEKDNFSSSLTDLSSGGVKGMKRILMLSILFVFLIIGCEKKSLPPQAKSENPPVPKVVVEKEKVGRELPLPPEVKIKLKKDGKDSYSWELSGSDADQILKVNEKLKKQLGGEHAR